MAVRRLAQFSIATDYSTRRSSISLGLVGESADITIQGTINTMNQNAGLLIDFVETTNTHTDICEVDSE